MNTPLTKEQREAIGKLLESSTAHACPSELSALAYLRAAMEAEAYWREIVAKSHPVVDNYRDRDDDRCYFCGNDLKFEIGFYWKKPDQHEADCPWLIAQGD